MSWTGDPKGKPVFVERDPDHGELEVYADEGGGSSVMVGRINGTGKRGADPWK